MSTKAIEHVLSFTKEKGQWTVYVVEDDLHPLYEQITHYLTDTNWEEWEKTTFLVTPSNHSLLFIQ